MTRAEFILASIEQGFMREVPEWVCCAIDRCVAPAVCETLNVGSRTERTFVPMCDGHLTAFFQGDPLEYVVEVHGFWPGHNIPLDELDG